MSPTEFMSYAGPLILFAGQVLHYYLVKDRLQSQTAEMKQTNTELAKGISSTTVQVAAQQTEDIREASAEITQQQTEQLRESSERKLDKLEHLETVAAASAKVASESAEVVDSIKILVNGSTDALKAENADLRKQLRALKAELAAPKPKKRA